MKITHSLQTQAMPETLSPSSHYMQFLHGGWEVAPAISGAFPAATDWLPAVVPGDVRLSLIASGRILDPRIGRNIHSSSWVADRDWWYRTQFPPTPAGERAFVLFDGLDYLADLRLDDRFLGHHEGMFSRQRYEVTGGGNLVVRLAAPATLRRPTLSTSDRIVAALLGKALGGEFFPPRLGTLKCQMTYGWDFAPALPTVGIWDSVRFSETGPVALSSAAVSARPSGEDAVVRIVFGLDSCHEAKVNVRVQISTLDGKLSASVERVLNIRSGVSSHSVTTLLAQPKRWEPWERGSPERYRAEITLDLGGRVSDQSVVTFGVRTIDVAAPIGGARRAPATDHVGLVVNGKSLFIRGANWVPADSLFGRMEEVDHRELISMAKAAGINMLRVWGGGLRERSAFYEQCDEQGMLVWQEFPLSVAFFDHFPRDPGYLAVLESEAAGIVRAIRNHPSVAIWCGGNEFSPARNKTVVAAMARAVASEDGSRPFRAASPGPGERHNWRVWHGWANVNDYRLDRAPLLSEFGLQAAPDPASLAEFLPDRGTGRPGSDWEEHSADLGKLGRYAQLFGPVPDGPVEFAAATQRAQALGLQVAIEHARRRKGRSVGTIFWQFNDPLGTISWSVVDYYRRPKLAYHFLRRIYAPVHVSLDYPLRRYKRGDSLCGTLWVVNDLIDRLTGLELLVHCGGTLVARRNVTVPSDTSIPIGPLEVRLPNDGPLELTLLRLGRQVAFNQYELDWEDRTPTSWYHAVRDWVTWGILS